MNGPSYDEGEHNCEALLKNWPLEYVRAYIDAKMVLADNRTIVARRRYWEGYLGALEKAQKETH